MLTQVIQVAVGILHVKDHGFALVGDGRNAICPVSIACSGKGSLTTNQAFVIEVHAKIDGP